MAHYLFYAMRGEKMCFQHVLLNALDLSAAGHTVRIVFEGESVKLPPVLAEEGNPLYQACLDQGLIAGVCQACAHMLGSLEAVKALGLPLLSDMRGHAGIRPYAEEGYETIVF